jgi:hypothetical protein
VFDANSNAYPYGDANTNSNNHSAADASIKSYPDTKAAS